MREIKFRARHKNLVSNKTGGWKWHYFTLNELVTGEAKEYAPFYEHWCEYTGLKDKNNKEIYEGDILLQHWSLRLIKGQVIMQATGDIGWSIDEGRGHIGYIGLNSNDIQEYEVIGNIYESPELLKYHKGREI